MVMPGDKSKPIPKKGLRCKGCLGTRGQHTGEEGCWCPRCLTKPEEDRCTVWEPVEMDGLTPKVDRDVVRVGHKHPETSKAAAQAVLPRSGSLRRQVYDVIWRSQAAGRSDDEIEKIMGKSHQSISACRNTLMNDKLIVDSGQRRRTQFGYMAICWVIAGGGTREVNS